MVYQSLNSSKRIQKVKKKLFKHHKLIMSVAMKESIKISKMKISRSERLKNLKILPTIKTQTDTSEIWKQSLVWTERKPLFRNKAQ
jgi:hypothetical protein